MEVYYCPGTFYNCDYSNRPHFNSYQNLHSKDSGNAKSHAPLVCILNFTLTFEAVFSGYFLLTFEAVLYLLFGRTCMFHRMLRQLTLMTLGLTCIPDVRQPFSVLIWMQTSIPADLVMNQILASQGLNVYFICKIFNSSVFLLLIFGTYAYMFF